MKAISVSTRKTKRSPIPALPVPLRRKSQAVFTATKARRIIKAHGGRPATAGELRQLATAGLAGLPAD